MCVYCLGLLAKRIASVTSGPTFRIENGPARYCLKLAYRLSFWISEHQDIALPVEKELVVLLLSWVQQISLTSEGCKTTREIWRAYHTLRTSGKYVVKRKEFLGHSGSSITGTYARKYRKC